MFGTSHRLPRTFTSDDLMDPDQLDVEMKGDYQKSHEMRVAATTALFKADAQSRLSRAAKARTRHHYDAKHGDWVFIHRTGHTGKIRWREGPGVVIMTSGTSAGVSVRDRLFKVAMEALRPATTEEQQGIDIVEGMLPELREELSRKKRRKEYWDLTGEGGAGTDGGDEPPPNRAPNLEEASTTAPSRQESTVSASRSSAASGATLRAAEQTNQDSERRTRPRLDTDVRTGPTSGQPAQDGPEPEFPGVPARVQNIEQAEEERAASSASRSSMRRLQQSLGLDQPDLAPPTSYGPKRDSARHEHREYYDLLHLQHLSLFQDEPLEDRLGAFGLSHSLCFATFSESQEVLFVRKRRNPDEVTRRDFSSSDWPQFEKAILKETTSMVEKNKALSPVSPKESARILREMPERVMRSRYALRWEPVNEDGKITHAAKCRWVVLGFEDPDVLELEGSCPSPQMNTINVRLP